MTTKAGHPRAAVRNRVYAEYGMTADQRGIYHIDHLVPRDLDGTNSIRNLWPQRAEAAHANLHGVAGNGEAIVCADNDGWRWEPV